MKIRLFGESALIFVGIRRNVGLHLFTYPREWTFGIVRRYGMKYICGGPLFQITIIEKQQGSIR